MKRIMKSVRIAALITVATLFLASCLITADDGNVGALRLDIPAIGASAIGSSDVVRVWMYAPSGAEYRLAPGGGGIPTDRNYVEVVGGGSVVIDQIPAGQGYGIVVVVDTGEATSASGANYVFTPDRYASNFDFPVAPGQETVLDLTLQAVSDVGSTAFYLEGVNLNSVIEIDDVENSNRGVYATTETKVYGPDTNGEVSLSELTTNSAIGRIFSATAGLDPNTASVVPYLNTDQGVSFFNGTGFPDINSSGATNVVSSGAFTFDSTGGSISDSIAVYYERLGGFGGTAFSLESLSGASWIDSGTELEDYVAADETPVRAAVGSVSSRAVYISSKFGTFQATEELFSGAEIDVASLISGESTGGLTFFGVAAPGSDRPVRITAMALRDIDGAEHLIIGSGRGVAYFPVTAIDNVSSNDGLIPTADVTWISVFREQVVLDMVVNDSGIAVVTPSRVGVWRGSSTDPISVPLRAIALGVPRGVALNSPASGNPTVTLAGSQGLSRIGPAAATLGGIIIDNVLN